MKSPQTAGFWSGILVMGLIWIILIMVTIGTVTGPTIAQAEAYETLYQEYAGIYQVAQNLEVGIKQWDENYVAELPTLVEKVGFSQWPQFAPIVTLVVMGLVALITSLIFQGKSIQDRRRLINKYEREMQRAAEQGKRDMAVAIANDLVSDKDVLSEMLVWQIGYKAGVAKLDKAARIQSQVLSRLAKQIRLSPIYKLQEEVKFDPNNHSAYEQLIPGEGAIVVEPGWRVGAETIKAPVLKRKSQI